MPSIDHEALVVLFENRPALAAELLRLLAVPGAPSKGKDRSARLASRSIDEVDLRQHDVDGVVLFGPKKTPNCAVVVEVQRSADGDKRLSWPLYIAHLRARHRCPVLLLVLALDRRIARWCARPIALGHPGFVLEPIVVTASALARGAAPASPRDNLELAVLAAVAQAKRPNAGSLMRRLIEVVLLGRMTQRYAYIDLLLASASPETRHQLEEWMSQTHEYQSDLFRRLVQQGREEGREEGREQGREEGRELGEAEAILKLLAARGLEVPAQVRDRILGCRDLAVLDRWLERAVHARTADEVVD